MPFEPKGEERFSILDSAGQVSVQTPAPLPAPPLVQPLFGQSLQRLSALMEAYSETLFRSRQLTQALYRDWTEDLDAITTLPAALRQRLAADGYAVGLPRILNTFHSVDGTERYLIAAGGDQTVETVWMPDGDGAEESDNADEATPIRRRATICVSSQIGCAVNCKFCLTAKLGIERNLTAGEIAGQVVAVLRRHAVELGRDRINLVFMGNGRAPP